MNDAPFTEPNLLEVGIEGPKENPKESATCVLGVRIDPEARHSSSHSLIL